MTSISESPRFAREGILELAAEAALDLILIADDERRVVELNRAAAKAINLPRSAILGRRIDEFFSEASGQPIPSAWNEFISEGVQCGFCELIFGNRRRIFDYRAKAHFTPGRHLSILRELPDTETASEAAG